MSYSLIITTVSSPEEGKKLLEGLLEKKQIACGNIIPSVFSRYWWEGKLETAEESMLLMKTESARTGLVIETIRQTHSYSVPEILCFDIEKGNPEYLKWITNCLSS